VVPLAADDQQGPAGGVLRVDLRVAAERIEVRERRLEERDARGRDVELLIQAPPSSSLRALTQPYWNCSHVKDTPRPTFAGFANTGAADFNDEAGSGSTPLNGALSIETVTAATPSPAIFCAMSPPKE